MGQSGDMSETLVEAWKHYAIPATHKWMVHKIAHEMCSECCWQQPLLHIALPQQDALPCCMQTQAGIFRAYLLADATIAI